MKIPIVSKETDEFLFNLELPFMEWRAWKTAAREASMTMDDWLEMVIRAGIRTEKSLRRKLRFAQLKLDR